MTQKPTEFAIFPTDWGHFGLLGADNTIKATCLPLSTPSAVRRTLLRNHPQAIENPAFGKPLQRSITAYFTGTYTDFSNVELDLADLTPFTRKVLLTCQKTPFAHIVSYSQLAKSSNHPKATRAAASVMAKNPIPLIIPCHRIIRSNGQIGQFSAPGGQNLKKQLINHETKAAQAATTPPK